METSHRMITSRLLKKFAVGAALLLAVAAEANIGYTLEGCRSTSLPDGYNLADHNYICPDSAYTTGNLKGWAELDLVPHRVTIENKGSWPAAFTFTVGGDYLYQDGGDLRGWDYISVLTLDDGLSNQICKDWAYANQDQLVVQGLYIDSPGVGGVDSTIYRQIAVAGGGPSAGVEKSNGLPAGAKCVANYVQRLALGSHLYTGSSLQSNLWDEVLSSSGGQKRLSIPDVQAATVDKTMTATQDETQRWAIAKSGPASVDFGDTCVPDAALQKNVDINVSWTKLPAVPAGQVGIHTIISMSNTASRAIYAQVSDTILNSSGEVGVYACGASDTALTVDGNYILIPSNYSGVVCEHDIMIPSADAVGLKDVATFSFADPVFPDPNWPIIGTLEANASSGVQAGNVNNTTVIVKDSESIYSTNGEMLFASGAFDPSDAGAYDNGYIAGTFTLGDINWTSFTTSDGGSVIFHKSVKIPEPMIVTGTLSDTATITNGSGDYLSEADHSVALSADATVSLKVTKNMPDVLQGSESVDVNFTVSKEGYEENKTMTFTAGMTYNEVTFNGLAPGTYDVTEHAPAGFQAVDSPTQQVSINLPSCSNAVHFDNELAGQPAVKVVKVTAPAAIEGVPQNGDWNVTLYKQTGPDTWVAVSSILTDPNIVQNVLVPDGQLEEGNYTIKEVMKNGWYESNKAGSCTFTVNYPADLYHADYVCTFTNTKYGKVIINKLTDPSGMPDSFHFTQDVNASYALNLTDMTGKVFMDVIPGQYSVTEDNPVPNFDLTGLSCTESDAPNPTATTTSLGQRLATINVDPGETVECTYTNRARGMVEVLKYMNGSTAYTTQWNFSLNGPGVNTSDSTPPALMDFGNAKLIPGATYTLCETGIPVAWNNTWFVGSTQVPYYIQNPGVTNEDHCYDFTVEANQTVHITVNNDYTPPGGEPRTIGYWKNWTTCDGKGNQVATAEKNGGFEAGFWLLDDVLPITIGTYSVDTCEKGIAVLNKESLNSGKKMAGDAAYGLAAQLLAAKANYQAGAQQCQAATDAINAGDALLADINFNGNGSYLKGGKNAKTQKAEATSIAGTLDSYNNGMLCQ